ncbi:hypothetical protein ACVV2G_15855 [Streptomyces ziwulingensis]
MDAVEPVLDELYTTPPSDFASRRGRHTTGRGRSWPTSSGNCARHGRGSTGAERERRGAVVRGRPAADAQARAEREAREAARRVDRAATRLSRSGPSG